MSPVEAVFVMVIVVVVVVDVFVIVGQPIMAVLVFVVGSKRHTDPGGGEHDGSDLEQLDRVAEDGPGNRGADERRSGEDDLAACGAEVTRAFDPQGDRQPVPGSADEQRNKHVAGIGGCAPSCGQRVRSSHWRRRRRHL